MIEIIVLVRLSSSESAATVRKKGHKKGIYQFMLVCLWFGGEIFGAIVGFIIGVITENGQAPEELFVYALRPGGRNSSAVIAFQMVKSLESAANEEAAIRHLLRIHSFPRSGGAFRRPGAPSGCTRPTADTDSIKNASSIHLTIAYDRNESRLARPSRSGVMLEDDISSRHHAFLGRSALPCRNIPIMPIAASTFSWESELHCCDRLFRTYK